MDNDSEFERRVDLASSLNRIEEKLKVAMRNVDHCRADRAALYKGLAQADIRIVKLETKQSIVTWVAGVFTLTGIGILVKSVYSHLKGH